MVAAAVPAVPGRALLRPAVSVPRPGVGLHREPAPHHAVLIADTRLIKSAVCTNVCDIYTVIVKFCDEIDTLKLLLS